MITDTYRLSRAWLIIFFIINSCSHVRTDEMEEVSTLRFGFGSCIEEPASPVWDKILAQKPDLFLFLGDNIYIRSEGFGNERWIRNRYQKMFSVQSFQRLIGKVPYFAIWDDHDFGNDNSDSHYKYGDISRKVFYEFWGQRDNPPGLEGSIAHKIRIGGVTILLTDNRTYRVSPGRAGHTPTMFGKRQLEWLSKELAKPEDSLVIIASGGQLLRAEQINETLSQYENDQRILSHAFAASPARIVVLSGDRHQSEILKDKFGSNVVVEATSSPLSGTIRLPENSSYDANQIGIYRGGNNFGIITVRRVSKELKITLEIFDQNVQRVLYYSDP